MDFIFGGSTLEMLANKDGTEPFYATQVPGTSAIMVVKRKDYEQNYADVGFQFERFVVGEAVQPTVSSIIFTEHLHVMKIEDLMVLFHAETDAIDDAGQPVEITFSNPHYWATKKMFQMISSGSTTLCAGRKERGVTVTRIDLRPLSDVAYDALINANVRRLEQNILECMQAEMEEKNDKEGQVYRIGFVGGKLKLTPSTMEVLPPSKVVRELI